MRDDTKWNKRDKFIQFLHENRWFGPEWNKYEIFIHYPSHIPGSYFYLRCAWVFLERFLRRFCLRVLCLEPPCVFCSYTS